MLLQRKLEWEGVLEVGETPATPNTYQASKIYVVSVFVIQIRIMSLWGHGVFLTVVPQKSFEVVTWCTKPN